jgi:hypothetical protein
MRNSIVIAALLLAACATPMDIYSSEIDIAETSPKPIGEISQCLQLRWAEAPITGPDGKLSFPMKNGYGQVLGLLTLTTVPGGTLLELRKTGQLAIGGENWRACA